MPKCQKCGAEFNGDFCPNCGMRAPTNGIDLLRGVFAKIKRVFKNPEIDAHIPRILDEHQATVDAQSCDDEFEPCDDTSTEFAEIGSLAENEDAEDNEDEEEYEDENWQERYEAQRKAENEYLGSHFDFNTVEEILAIPLDAETPFDTVTGQVEYYLQRKATRHKREHRMDLAIACLRKSNEIMSNTDYEYNKKDYLRLVEYLKQDRQFDEARKEQSKIDEMFSSSDSVVLSINSQKELSDLVQVTSVSRCCEKCAMFRDRIYSVSGTDKRFPKFPDFLDDNPNHCGLFAYPFIEGISFFRNRNGDTLADLSGIQKAIEYSNRPFVDDRTDEEKEKYEQYIAETANRKRDKEEFDWIREFLPELAPKSFGGYRRMKSSNSKNYQKLADAAKGKGHELHGDGMKGML